MSFSNTFFVQVYTQFICMIKSILFLSLITYSIFFIGCNRNTMDLTKKAPCIAISEDLGDIKVSVEGTYF